MLIMSSSSAQSLIEGVSLVLEARDSRHDSGVLLCHSLNRNLQLNALRCSELCQLTLAFLAAMDCYDARLQSFKKTRRVKAKSSTVVLKWPHPDTYLATPEQLAEAGFYFNPTPDARDNVKCFMCDKELNNWDEDDDPISQHFARCRDVCAWAVARCGNMEDLDTDGRCVMLTLRFICL